MLTFELKFSHLFFSHSRSASNCWKRACFFSFFFFKYSRSLDVTSFLQQRTSVQELKCSTYFGNTQKTMIKVQSNLKNVFDQPLFLRSLFKTTPTTPYNMTFKNKHRVKICSFEKKTLPAKVITIRLTLQNFNASNQTRIEHTIFVCDSFLGQLTNQPDFK